MVCVFWYSCQRSHDFLKQSAVLFPRIWGWLTAQIPYRSCLTRRISNYLFLVNDSFEHGLMVGVSFSSNSTASVLSFVPFTARLRNITAWGGPCLTDWACLMSLTASAADCTSIPLGWTGTTARVGSHQDCPGCFTQTSRAIHYTVAAKSVNWSNTISLKMW